MRGFLFRADSAIDGESVLEEGACNPCPAEARNASDKDSRGRLHGGHTGAPQYTVRFSVDRMYEGKAQSVLAKPLLIYGGRSPSARTSQASIIHSG